MSSLARLRAALAAANAGAAKALTRWSDEDLSAPDAVERLVRSWGIVVLDAQDLVATERRRRSR